MATYLPNVTDVFPEPALFTPDFSFMDKMLQRRKALYDQGFAQINSSYNFVNRETTNAYNTKVKEQFLRQAKDNLKNLSSMDLSQAQNVNAARNVFSPFYNNFDVVGDQSLTEHWNRQVQIGNGFRLKDGGKNFHQNNIDYITQQKNYFANDTPDAWKEYYGSKRMYTPYYDYKKEVAERMKDFKPSHTKLVKKDGFYINIVDEKSWLPGEIANYLDAVLSDQAKTQMRIDGSVKYGNNIDVLGKVYNDAMAPTQGKLQQKILELEIDIRRSEGDPEKQAKLIEERDGYQARQNEISNNFSVTGTGDMTFIRRNAENLAYGIFYDEEINKLANGYSHLDIEQDIKFDDVQMMFWKDAQEWGRMYKKREWELQDKKKEKEDGTLPYVNVQGGSTTPTATNITALENDFYTAANESLAAQDALANHIRLDLNKKPGEELNQYEFSDWAKKHPTNSLVIDFNEKSAAANAAQANVEGFAVTARNFIADKMGNDKFNAYVNLKKEIQSGKKLDATTLGVYNKLNESYNSFLYSYNDPNFTRVGTSYPSFGLNPSDKRFGEAVGTAATLTGIDPSVISGGLIFTPTGPDGLDVEFNVSVDPTKTTITKTQIENSLKRYVGEGNYDYNQETGVVKIMGNPSKSFQQYNQYGGFSKFQAQTMHHIASTPFRGTAIPIWYTDVSADGYPLFFNIVKGGNNLYYLKNTSGTKNLTDEPFRSITDLGLTVRRMCMSTGRKEINKFINQK